MSSTPGCSGTLREYAGCTRRKDAGLPRRGQLSGTHRSRAVVPVALLSTGIYIHQEQGCEYTILLVRGSAQMSSKRTEARVVSCAMHEAWQEKFLGVVAKAVALAKEESKRGAGKTDVREAFARLIKLNAEV